MKCHRSRSITSPSHAILLGLWAMAACSPAGESPGPMIAKDGIIMTITLSPEYLRDRGFREQDGRFLRDRVRLDELAKVVGFEPVHLIPEPGRDPDEPRYTIELGDGRCL